MADNIQPDSSRMSRKGSGNVIKFGKAKKSLARSAKDKTAAENRARFGLKKSEKEKRAELAKKMQDKLNAHKRDPDD